MNILLGILFIMGLIAIVKIKLNQQPKKIDLERPEWIMTDSLSGALISENKSVYTTHLFRSKPEKISYKGIYYKVLSANHIDDPRATKGFSMSGSIDSDVTLLTHEPVSNIEPVKIAQRAKKGDRGIIYRVKSSAISAYIKNATSSIKLKSKLKHGDSGSPITNEKGELISLASTSGGEGPNLTRIKDILLD